VPSASNHERAFERHFVAHGQSYGLQASDGDLLDLLAARVPLGWHPSPILSSDISEGYVLRRTDGDAGGATYRLTAGGDALIESSRLPDVLDAFERHAELLAAERASDSLFVHAGVVAWHDRAIVLPGASGSGKTTLVRAFLAAGATYLSDEFARFDREGRVHPYPRALSIRSSPNHSTSVSAAELGARIGTTALPVRVILLTSYQPGAIWEPQRVSPAYALVKLMEHTVAARRDAEYSMSILKAVVTRAIALESTRPEPDVVVRGVLQMAMSSVREA